MCSNLLLHKISEVNTISDGLISTYLDKTLVSSPGMVHRRKNSHRFENDSFGTIIVLRKLLIRFETCRKGFKALVILKQSNGHVVLLR